MQVPVLADERPCGCLWAERRGLYTVFQCEVETDQVCKLWAVFACGELALGIPAPERGKMGLCVSVPTVRLPGGALLRGELRTRDAWRRFSGGRAGEAELPPCQVRGEIYRFPWNPGDPLPCEELLCFFRFVREGERGYLELRLDRTGNPKMWENT